MYTKTFTCGFIIQKEGITNIYIFVYVDVDKSDEWKLSMKAGRTGHELFWITLRDFSRKFKAVFDSENSDCYKFQKSYSIFRILYVIVLIAGKYFLKKK